MTKYINSGARWVTGVNIKSKAELKRELKAQPNRIKIYTTGEFPREDYEVTASDLGNIAKPDEVWQICGPDPYRDRRWYASVKVNRLGNLVVT